jgi:hypothetical protein
MNGAIADPSVRTIRVLKRNKNKMIGVSHHFFRFLKNVKNSNIIDNLDIIAPAQFKIDLHNFDLSLFPFLFYSNKN